MTPTDKGWHVLSVRGTWRRGEFAVLEMDDGTFTITRHPADRIAYVVHRASTWDDVERCTDRRKS